MAFISPNYPILDQYMNENDCGLSALTITYNLLPKYLKTPLPEIALLFPGVHTPSPFSQGCSLPSSNLPRHFIYTFLFGFRYFIVIYIYTVLCSHLTLSSWKAHTPDSILHP